jgi:hypothetical protein
MVIPMDLPFLDLLYVMVTAALHCMVVDFFSKVDKNGYTSKIALFLIAWDIHLPEPVVELSHDASL